PRPEVLLAPIATMLSCRACNGPAARARTAAITPAHNRKTIRKNSLPKLLQKVVDLSLRPRHLLAGPAVRCNGCARRRPKGTACRGAGNFRSWQGLLD